MAAEELRRMLAFLGARDWDGLATTVTPDITLDLLHTGERITGREAFVAFQRDYPGEWNVTVQEVVAEGDRAVARILVTDGSAVYHAATFATVRDGQVAALVEVWADSDGVPPVFRG